MLRIRLRRVGAKNNPYYQIVLCDSRTSGRGKIIEKLGNYNSKPDSKLIGVKKDRIDYWIKKGAQLSNRMESVLKKMGETTTGGGLNEIAG